MTKIDETQTTPEIIIDDKKNLIHLKGKSTILNAYNFYKSVLDMVDFYIKKEPDETKVIFELEYFNTTTSRAIVEMLKKLKKLKQNGKKLYIECVCDEDDEEMIQAGNDINHITKLNLLIKKY